MNEEKDKIINQTEDIATQEILTDNVSDNKLSSEETFNYDSSSDKIAANEVSKEDISNVKIRTILNQRLKKWRPNFKKVIPLLLVGIICFMAGIGADRLFIGRRVNKAFNRPGINQAMPRNGSNSKQFNNNKNNKNLPSTNKNSN
jgi:hypothetical protein